MSKTAFLLILSWWILQSAQTQDLKIIHFDVGNADATLFITASGENFMVDSGNQGDADEIFSILQQEGINEIDHYVTTHYHADHYGSIDVLIDTHGLDVLNAYDRGDKAFLQAKTFNSDSYIDYQRELGSRAIHLTRGMVIQSGDLRATCLSSGGAVMGEDNPHVGADENDRSIALLIEYHGFRYFVGGDIHKPVEKKIAAADLAVDVDIYQANHHGSHTSSALEFLEDMQPSVIIISNGNNKRFAHPRKVTLDVMQALNPSPDIFQTNKFTKSNAKAGNVADEFIADLEPSGNEGNIFVELTGSTYTISFGTFSKDYIIKNTPSSGALVIESLVPNPVGEDTELEEVVLRNVGSSVVFLDGWSLTDASGRSWRLNATLDGGQHQTILRNGGAMSLNNDGDTIELVNANGEVVDEFRYIGSTEGQRIETGH